MATRYSGDLTIRVTWLRWYEGKDEYSFSVTNGRTTRRGKVRLSFFMTDPRTPVGYDKAAEAAVRKAKLPGGGQVSRVFECPCPGHPSLHKRAERRKR